MKLITKINYGYENEKHKVRLFCGIPYFETIVYKNKEIKTKKHRLILNYNQFKNKTFERFLYLKVNRSDFFSVPCIQHWIDTAYEMNTDFVIICDKHELQDKILKECNFHNLYPKFIKSYIKPLTNIVNKICRTNFWKKATYAHLSTIYHASKNNIKNFWNIDADDTMILLSPKRTAELIIEAEKYAKKNNIDAFSLDMHETENNGKNFTWGVTYLRDSVDWMSLFNNIKDNSWQEDYLDIETAFNSDNYMLYLKDKKIKNNKSFYVEDLYFLHYANITTWLVGYTLYNWSQGFLHFPILKSLNMNNMDLKISKKCENIGFKINENESLNIARKVFLKKDILEKERRRWY